MKQSESKSVEKLLEIDKIKEQISNDKNEDNSLLLALEQLEEKLNKIYDFETKGLIISSRACWLEEGERSSKYFCNLENRSWQKKNIYSIIDDDANVISDQSLILKNIHKFYSKLYSIQDNLGQDSRLHDLDAFFNSVESPKLTEEENLILKQPLSKQELFDVLKTMKSNKTPGYDGLPVEFYIVFWPDVSDLLIDAYNFSLRHGMLSLSQRNGIITLLPKKDKDPMYIKNYRPITLLTVDYKILAKCIANRLKRLMGHLIHSDQSGFLKGGYIGTNVRLILDVIEYADENDLPGSIVLLDIEKAFDSVRHDFFISGLEAL